MSESTTTARIPIWRPTLVFILAFTVLTGLIYPLFITGVAQVAFTDKANGSMLRDNQGLVRGTRLMGQDFESDQFFHGRPSATGYAATSSGATNLAITSAAQAKNVKDRADAWKQTFGNVPPPPDMLYASGSGLDYEISLESAIDQLDHVAAARGFGEPEKASLRSRIMRLSGQVLPGENPRVNVTVLNWYLVTDPAFVHATPSSAK